MAAPLSEKGVELERTLGFFQFNRDVDDEEVRTLRLGLYEMLTKEWACYNEKTDDLMLISCVFCYL